MKVTFLCLSDVGLTLRYPSAIQACPLEIVMFRFIIVLVTLLLCQPLTLVRSAASAPSVIFNKCLAFFSPELTNKSM